MFIVFKSRHNIITMHCHSNDSNSEIINNFKCSNSASPYGEATWLYL